MTQEKSTLWHRSPISIADESFPLRLLCIICEYWFSARVDLSILLNATAASFRSLNYSQVNESKPPALHREYY